MVPLVASVKYLPTFLKSSTGHPPCLSKDAPIPHFAIIMVIGKTTKPKILCQAWEGQQVVNGGL